MKTRFTLLSTLLLLSSLSSFAFGSVFNQVDQHLDEWKDTLILESPEGDWYLEPQLQADLWYYHRDSTTNSVGSANGDFIGFWFPRPGEHSRVSERLTLKLNLHYKESFYFFFKGRWDDGVHPGVAHYYGDKQQLRADEWYMRYSASAQFQFQIGQFTPIFGNFLNRQNSWEMPLISYPISYENVSSVSDKFIPTNDADFINRKNAWKNPINWVTAVWAPLYNRGISAFGDFGKVTYALSVMNSAPSSRGLWWDDNDFSYPTVYSRIAYRPNAGMKFGFNLSHGTYLHHSNTDQPPSIKDNTYTPPSETLITHFNDYQQTVASIDMEYAHRDWRFWGEVLYTHFETPTLSNNPSYISYYIEAQYKINPKWWLAARWNQEIYNKINQQNWSYDINRIDLGLGYRFSRHAQIKLQHSWQHLQSAPHQAGTKQLLAEMTIQF